MMRSERPMIDPDGRYGMMEAARLLGVDPKTLLNATKRDVSAGGIRFTIRRGSSRKVFRGAELLRYWDGR